MRPRFTNPYLLPQQTEIISRTCLYPEDGNVEDDENKLKMLQRLIGHTMIQCSGSNDTPVPLSEEEDDSISEGKVLFRLISASIQPTPISLHPRPPPPSATREPDTEDTHEQALTRRQRSEAVAIDGSTILRESVITERPRLDKSIAISHAEIPTPAPPLLLITMKQQPRKTRRPVLSNELACYPYNTKVKICPTLDVDLMQLDTKKSSRRQRRKWLKVTSRQEYGSQATNTTGMTQKSKRDRIKTAIEMPS